MSSAHRLRRWRLGLVCLLSTGGALGTFASVLGAQNVAPAVSEILDRLPDASAREAVRGALAEANARGLPSAPLVTKVREGLAKGAAPQRISAATIALGKRLATASMALAPAQSVDELVAGADVLQVGIAESTLRDMRRTWPTKALTVPLGVLAELVASGVPPGNATSRVRELLTRGANTTQLAALSNTVRADVAAGLAPDAALELRSKGVLSLLAAPATNALTASPNPTPTTGIRPPL